MCLVFVHNHTLREQKFYYKVFRDWGHANKFVGLYLTPSGKQPQFNRKELYVEGVWYTATEFVLDTSIQQFYQTYVSGFHAFTNKKRAKHVANQYEDGVVLKVKLKEIGTYGFSGTPT